MSSLCPVWEREGEREGQSRDKHLASPAFASSLIREKLAFRNIWVLRTSYGSCICFGPVWNAHNQWLCKPVSPRYVHTCSRILRVFSIHYQSSFLQFSTPEEGTLNPGLWWRVLKYNGWFLFQIPKNEGLPMYTKLTDFSFLLLKWRRGIFKKSET